MELQQMIFSLGDFFMSKTPAVYTIPQQNKVVMDAYNKLDTDSSGDISKHEWELFAANMCGDGDLHSSLPYHPWEPFCPVYDFVPQWWLDLTHTSDPDMAALRAEQIYPSIDLNCDDKVLGVELNYMFYSIGQYYNEKTGNPAPTDD